MTKRFQLILDRLLQHLRTRDRRGALQPNRTIAHPTGLLHARAITQGFRQAGQLGESGAICERPVTAWVYASEWAAMSAQSAATDEETITWMFGFQRRDQSLVITLCIGPGEDAQLSATRAQGDLEQLKRRAEQIGRFTKQEAIGRAHAHGVLELRAPSETDRASGRSFMRHLGAKRLVEVILTKERGNRDCVRVDGYSYIDKDDTCTLARLQIGLIPGVSPVREQLIRCGELPGLASQDIHFPLSRIVCSDLIPSQDEVDHAAETVSDELLSQIKMLPGRILDNVTVRVSPLRDTVLVDVPLTEGRTATLNYVAVNQIAPASIEVTDASGHRLQVSAENTCEESLDLTSVPGIYSWLTHRHIGRKG